MLKLTLTVETVEQESRTGVEMRRVLIATLGPIVLEYLRKLLNPDPLPGWPMPPPSNGEPDIEGPEVGL